LRDVWPLYFAADVFALPSHSEGSPNVLLEAMAAGIPIVATAVGGVPEIIEHNQSALLVSPNDPQALAVALVRALTEKDFAKSLAANASLMVETRYTSEKYVRSLYKIYRNVMASRLNN
jgi:glycosyltransferase involved in cell wall biosynthesis